MYINAKRTILRLSFSWRRMRFCRLLRPRPCMLSGFAWCAKLFWLKTVCHTVFFTPKPSRVQIPHVKTICKCEKGQSFDCPFSWRRMRDLNPRGSYPPYALSRGASSTSWVILQMSELNSFFIKFLFWCRYGGEGGIRTHGSCESLVFKTSSLNHSDTSPYLKLRIIYYQTKHHLSRDFFDKWEHFLCDYFKSFFER